MKQRIVSAIAVFAAAIGFLSTGAGAAYHNVALNPKDVHDSVWLKQPVKLYPHARSNSECRMEACFMARCAISDTINNLCHGPACPSWGPDQSLNIWWLVDFGKEVAVDSVTLYIRHDFPHDSYWYKGILNFSDSSRIRINIDSTAKGQGYKFSKRVTRWMRIDSLVWRVPNTWCAMTQVKVWGDDATGAAPFPAKAVALAYREASVLYAARPGQAIVLPAGISAVSFWSLDGRNAGSYTRPQSRSPEAFVLPVDHASGMVLMRMER